MFTQELVKATDDIITPSLLSRLVWKTIMIFNNDKSTKDDKVGCNLLYLSYEKNYTIFINEKGWIQQLCSRVNDKVFNYVQLYYFSTF